MKQGIITISIEDARVIAKALKMILVGKMDVTVGEMTRAKRIHTDITRIITAHDNDNKTWP